MDIAVIRLRRRMSQQRQLPWPPSDSSGQALDDCATSETAVVMVAFAGFICGHAVVGLPENSLGPLSADVGLVCQK